MNIMKSAEIEKSKGEMKMNENENERLARALNWLVAAGWDVEILQFRDTATVGVTATRFRAGGRGYLRSFTRPTLPAALFAVAQAAGWTDEAA